MSFVDFFLPLPSEMQFCDSSLWHMPEDTIEMGREDAYQLGFVKNSWLEQRRVGNSQPLSTPSSSFPEDNLPLTPLINHSSTFKANSPTQTLTRELFTLRDSTSESLPIFVANESTRPTLEPILVDRWTNSQSSLVDSSPKPGKDRLVDFTPRLAPFPSIPSLRGVPADNSPELEPDSADTSFSTLGPTTPPSADADHLDQYSIRQPTPALPSIPAPRPKRRRVERDINDALADPIFDSDTIYIREKTLEVEVEANSSESASPPPKKVCRKPTPAPSVKRPGITRRPSLRGSGPRTRGSTTHISTTTAHASVSTPSHPTQAIAAPAGDPLDVLASAATMRLGVADQRTGSSAFVRAQTISIPQLYHPDPEPEEWAPTQIGSSPLRLTQRIIDTNTYRQLSTPSHPDLLLDDDIHVAGPNTIPSSEIPGSKNLSPAKSTSSDETAESETTPTVDSRSRRAKEREEKRLEKLSRDSRIDVEEEEEFTPGPRGRSRTIGLQLKQRFLSGEVFDTSDVPGEDIDLARGLLAFGTRAVQSVLKTSRPLVLQRSDASVGSSRLTSLSQASSSRNSQSSSTIVPTQGKGKVKPLPQAPTSSRASNVSRFVAPAQTNRDGSSTSLTNKRLGERVKNTASLRKEDTGRAATKCEGDREERAPLHHKVNQPNHVPPKVLLPQKPAAAELARLQPPRFISISESAKLRRSRQNATLSTSPTTSSAPKRPAAAPKIKPLTKAKRTDTPSAEIPLRNIGTKSRPSMSPAPTVTSPSRATRSSNGIYKRKKADVMEEEEEEEEKKAGGAKDGSSRIYAEGELQIMLAMWDGRQPITKGLLATIKQALIDAGHNSERTPEALKWYMKNTLWTRFAERYGLSKTRDLSQWRTASGNSRTSS